MFAFEWNKKQQQQLTKQKKNDYDRNKRNNDFTGN